MSITSINCLCRDIARNPALRRALQSDPQSELARYPREFSEVERTALLAGDVRALYQMGVNSHLLSNLARYNLFGLDMQSYLERKGSWERFEVMNILVR